MRFCTVGLLAGLLASTAAWAQAGGCSKDTDCKGDRICVNGACMEPQQQAPQPPPPDQGYQQQQQPQYNPQYNQPNYPPNYPPPPPNYPPQPPPNYPPQPPPSYYPPPPPPPAYRPVVYNPLVAAVSASIGGESITDANGNTGGFLLLDGYGELGGKLSPGFSLVGLADVNLGIGSPTSVGNLSLGGGFGFGRWNRLTVGAGFLWSSLGSAGVIGIVHLSLPLSGSGFGLHLQASAGWTNNEALANASIGFGFSR